MHKQTENESKILVILLIAAMTIVYIGSSSGMFISALGYSQPPSEFSDLFDNQIDPTGQISTDPIRLTDNIFTVATATTVRWIQYNPIDGQFLQQDEVMKLKSVSQLTQLLGFGKGSFLILNNEFSLSLDDPSQALRNVNVVKSWAYTKYRVTYRAYPKSDGLFGGFALRFVDINNFISFQPYTNGEVKVLKYKNGLDATSELIITKHVAGGWQNGNFEVTATPSLDGTGYDYIVKVNGVTHLTIKDTKKDFVPSPIGLYGLTPGVNAESVWDDFRALVL